MFKYYCIPLLLVAGVAHGQYIPKGFQHFYEYEERVILFMLPHDTYYETKVLANYYGIDNIQEVEKFGDALVESGIKKGRVKEVIDTILGDDVNQAEIQTVYSYEDNTLQVDVNSDFMDEGKGKVKYTNINPDSSAVIINNRVYTSYYDKDLNATLNNDVIIGLGKGYIETDVSLFASSEGRERTDFDVNNVKYELNFEGHSLQLGYASYGVVKDNSTSVLDYSHSRDSYYVSLSSSDNLLSVNDYKQKQLYFDIKNSGTVDIIRDGKTLFSRSYPEGQHSISYAKLPRGNYDIELRIRADGYAEEKIIRRINNNVSKTTHKGYDYNVSLRQSEYDTDQDVDTLVYGEASITKSFMSDELLLGINSRSDGDAIDFGATAIYAASNLGAAIYYNQLPDGMFYQTSLSLSGLSLDYEKLNVNDSHSLTPLVSAVYGQESYDQVTLSYSFPVANGSVSIYGSKLHRDGSPFQPDYGTLYRDSNLYDNPSLYNNSIYRNELSYNSSSIYNRINSIYSDIGEYYTGEIDSTNLAVNYQANIVDNISLSVGYSLTMNNKFRDERDGIVSLNVSIPLGNEHLSYSGGYESSKRNNGRVSNTMTYQDSDLGLFSSADSSGGASLSNYIDGGQSETSLNGNINLSNDNFRATGYANYSNQGNSNLSTTLESTSVISGESLSQTKDFNHSYIVVKSNDTFDDIAEDEDLGMLGLQVNNGLYIDEQILGETTLIGLDYFKSYKFNIDNEISGYRSQDQEKSRTEVMFSYPGSVHTISNDVEEVVSFLSFFEDFNDKSLNNIKCLGEGCVSVNRVGDGIYSISLIKDLSFKIVSNGQFCFVEPGEIQRNQAKSKCFPTIEADDDGMQLVSSGLGEQGDIIYYLGVLEDNIPDEMLLSLESADIEYIEYEFAKGTHLFAKINSKREREGALMTLAQMDIIDELQSYVRNNSEANDFALN